MSKNLANLLIVTALVVGIFGGAYFFGSMPATSGNLGASIEPFNAASVAAVTCTTATSTTALAADSSRLYAVITQTNAVDTWLKLGSTATASSGILLTGKGASYEINADNPYNGIITCFPDSATSTLVVTYK